MQFINLRLFSHYSRFQSIIKIPDLSQLDVPVLALVDKNLCGAIEFIDYCIKNQKKPILGQLIFLEKYGELVFFFKNLEAYKFICELIKYPNITLDLFIKIKNDFVVTSGDDYFDQDLSPLKELKDFFPDFFIEIQEKKGKNKLLKFANDYHIPIVITNPTRFLYPEDEEAFYTLQSIKDNKKFNQEEFDNFTYKTAYYPQETQINEWYNLYPDGINNTVLIGKKCNCFIPTLIPQIPLPIMDNKLETNIDILNQKLRELSEKFLKEKNISLEKLDIYKKRLNYELDILTMKNFAPYFLVTYDFVQYALNNNIAVGPGRGSGAGSLVAYLLNITNIDPIYHELLFERFLNPERVSIPDFDIDFDPDYIPQILNYLKDKYGKYNVTHIITFGLLQPKGLIRDICRVFHIPYKESDEIAKLIPFDQIIKISFQDIFTVVPELMKYKQNPRYNKIFAIALKLENVIRNYSRHAAGIILHHEPIYKLSPISYDDHGELVTQFSLKYIESTGCVKFDFLGLKTLSIISQTIQLIDKHVDLFHINYEDPKVYELICNLHLEGIFQFEGYGIRRVVHLFQPKKFLDLVVITSLYRPGPVDLIEEYINRKNNKKPITYLHSSLEILKNTYGIMVFQEQVMQVAQVCAGYSLAEADNLRRAMGKKKPEEMAKQKSFFIQGCLKNNISQSIAEEIFILINKFAGYAFNKSHAAAYSTISYQCAYLKTYYPKEFLVSCINVDISDKEQIIMYLSSAKRLNVTVLPPSVQFSKAYFSIKDDQIVYGLLGIKSVGKNIAESIEKNQPYPNIYEFVALNKNNLNKRSWEFLVNSGALDCFDINKSTLLENFDALKEGIPMIDGVLPWDKKNEQLAFGCYFSSPFKIEDKVLNSNIQNEFLAEILYVKRKRTGNKVYASCVLIHEFILIQVNIPDYILYNYNSILQDGNLVRMIVQINNQNGLTQYKCEKVFLY